MCHYQTRTNAESEAILTLATETMEAKLNAGEPFTALDISNALKAKNFAVRHREVSAVVRGLWASGGMDTFGYTRELIIVTTPDGPAQAYLYHHNSQTLADYDKNAQDALPVVDTAQARPLDDAVPANNPLSPLAKAALQGMVGGAVINGNGYTPNGKPARTGTRSSIRQDGAIAVPRMLIEQAGFVEGDTLVLTHDPQTGTLSLEPVPTGASGVVGAIVKVWGDLRVRIAKTKVQIAGFVAYATLPPQKPNFAIQGNALRIEP